MNIFDERIKKLQEQLIKDGLKAYIIPATDPHLSEMYAPRFGAMRYYFCSFKGETGTLLVTQTDYYLYTDGRFWTEAENELKGTSCKLVYAGKANVLSMSDFIKENNLYPLGLDSSLFSLNEVKGFYVDDNHKIISKSYLSLVEDLPPMPKDKIFKIDEELLSTTRYDRVMAIVSEMKKQNAKACLLTALDDIAYVIGYRGNDIAYTPVFYSYLYINEDGVSDLFIDEEKIPNSFNSLKVNIHKYEDLIKFLDERKDVPTMIDLSNTNALICSHLKNIINATSPASIFKAIKGKVEVENIKRIHKLDGIAVLKLQKYIEDNIDKGLDELKCAEFIDNTRLKMDECFELSFETIAAVDSNAAMMHYAPSENSNAKLYKDSKLLLVDSGGQYYGGTTDITRTFLIKPTKEVIKDYTLTLKSQIALSKTVFEKGCSGLSLDIIAREVFWKEGMDYKCGTGHGVGYISCVHEGPVSFRYYVPAGRKVSGILTPGHIITVEPGVYKAGKYGIRLENELLVVDGLTTDDGIFYKFETVTYCPYDRKGIDVSLLDDEELKWLNDYLGSVYDTLAPLIDDEELLAYLRKQCAPFLR